MSSSRYPNHTSPTSGTTVGEEVSTHIAVPYSAKFSRRIIFAVFADWSRTAKIKLANFFNTSSAQRRSLDSELYRHANMEHTLDIFFGT